MPEGRHICVDRLVEEAIAAYQLGIGIVSFSPDQDEELELNKQFILVNAYSASSYA